ncbi:MAG: hypothetical protein SPJ04_02115 [Bdellovibrionota bacterium]|nr:hypothetical protein [Bdellovibrionota bacterium]
MIRVLNKNNLKNLINSLDIPCDNKTRNIISNIFLLAINITQNEVKSDTNITQDQNDLRFSKEFLINELNKINKSTKEILTLMLYKIIHVENFNVTPIEWLTAESLRNLMKFSYSTIFPVSGKNLFYKWCYVYNNNLINEIENVKEQINEISLPAKILIYNEIIKWRTSEFKDNNFDLFLQFLSFLHEEEVHNLMIKDREAM